MSLNYGVIVPHPPIMVPSVGGREGIGPIEKTVNSMLKISRKIAEIKPDLIITISPHGLIMPDSISVRVPHSGVVSGSLAEFGDENVGLEKKIDRKFIENLINHCAGSGIKLVGTDDEYLDHGVIAPMSYIDAAMSNDYKIVTLNITLGGLEHHYNFGKILRGVCEADDRKIVFVASGDLSHCLTKKAPVEYNAEGPKFDKKLVEYLQKGETARIIYMDPFWLDEVAECGLRSIVTMMGAMDKKSADCNILSYEGPYGVGYLVAEYEM
ncbi:AmmeMemoRadiSam system protein B [Patescibacteria group bacterium]|nr:AmmeMemoRadiSam system protein B [Patescibacteria group bacterium]